MEIEMDGGKVGVGGKESWRDAPTREIKELSVKLFS